METPLRSARGVPAAAERPGDIFCGLMLASLLSTVLWLPLLWGLGLFD